MSNAPNLLAPGSFLGGGKYRVDALIGQGGMGAVYEGLHVALNRPVAIKMLAPHLIGDETHLERFRREALIAGQLNHPHIVQMLDVCAEAEQSDPPFLVMERLEGEPLLDILRRDAPLPPARIGRLMVQLLSALSAAHEAGVVHRDLKPANLFITRGYDGGELLKVLDFGVARLTDSENPLTGAGHVLGTLNYMAPEQATGDAVDARADIYAVGVILWTALVGHPPFKGANPAAVLHQVLAGSASRLVVLRPELGPLAKVVDRAMSVTPEGRQASAAEMAAELSGVPLADAVVPAMETKPDVPPTRPDHTTTRPQGSMQTPAVSQPVVEQSTSPGPSKGRLALAGLGLLLFGAILTLAAIGVMSFSSTPADAPAPPETLIAATDAVIPVVATDPLGAMQPHIDAGVVADSATATDTGAANREAAAGHDRPHMRATNREASGDPDRPPRGSPAQIPICRDMDILFRGTTAHANHSSRARDAIFGVQAKMPFWNCLQGRANPGTFHLSFTVNESGRVVTARVRPDGAFSPATARCLERMLRTEQLLVSLEGPDEIAHTMVIRCD